MEARGVPIPYGCYEVPTYRHEAVKSKHLDVSFYRWTPEVI